MAYSAFKRHKNPYEKLVIGSDYFIKKFYERLDGVSMRDWISPAYWNDFEIEEGYSIHIKELYSFILPNNILGNQVRVREDLYLLPMRWVTLPVQVKEFLLKDSTYQAFLSSRANSYASGKIHPRYAFEYFMYGLLSFGNSKSLINFKTEYFLSAWYKLI